MTPAFKAVEAAAMALSVEERAELIERLADTVLPAPPMLPEWEAEVARRAADLDAGRTQAVPAGKTFGEMRAMIEAAMPGR